MEVSKIHLSAAEIELMQNAEIILTKNRVLKKIKLVLEEVQEQQIDFVKAWQLSHEIFTVSPKISKGEYYLGLPYFILDYPRQSSRKNLFFIRTMFWWGNFFSCTLHLTGDSKEAFKEKMKQSYSQLKNYYVSISDDQWEHHLQESAYRKIDTMTEEQFSETCESFDHLKIAGKLSLNEWEKAPSKLFEDWRFFLSLCGLIA